MNALLRRKSRHRQIKHDYEESDVSPRLILLTGVGLFAGVGVSLIVVFGILRSVEPTSGPPAAVFTPLRGRPRLEVSPSADRDALQSQAQGRLHDYGWTDRTAQIAHIPIDRAMAILAARGWPDPDNGQESRP